VIDYLTCVHIHDPVGGAGESVVQPLVVCLIVERIVSLPEYLPLSVYIQGTNVQTGSVPMYVPVK